jgi:hypothetical protein
LAAMVASASRRRSRMVWVLGALVVTAGIAVAAYVALGRRPVAPTMAPAPGASRAPSLPAPAATPGVPAVAESARSDTAPRAPTATSGAPLDSARPHETTGLLLFSTDPVTAEILLDGMAIGSDGFVDSEVAAGRRQLQISAPGYETLGMRIRVDAGGTTDLGRLVLREAASDEPAPASQATGRLGLQVVPPTAQVFVDGKLVGVGALVDFEVAVGQRRLRISAPGYLTLDTLITVQGATTLRLGQIILRSGPGGP